MKKTSSNTTLGKANTGNDNKGSNPQSAPSSSDKAATSGETKSLLEKLFLDMLKDIYWAEDHLINKLQVMKEAAFTEELKDAFEDHLYATHKHKSRLEKVFRLLGARPEGKKCDAMEGLTKEAEKMIEATAEGTMTRDAGLIIAAQKIEHYEIATYGSLVQIALTLDQDEAADLLEQTLWEEEDTDLLLTDIAETSVNPLADEEEEEDAEESSTGPAEQEEKQQTTEA
jgi:ferritin-like metal-binding protein YciE